MEIFCFSLMDWKIYKIISAAVKTGPQCYALHAATVPHWVKQHTNLFLIKQQIHIYLHSPDDSPLWNIIHRWNSSTNTTHPEVMHPSSPECNTSSQPRGRWTFLPGKGGLGLWTLPALMQREPEWGQSTSQVLGEVVQGVELERRADNRSSWQPPKQHHPYCELQRDESCTTGRGHPVGTQKYSH